jgi:hypothetical protein
MDKLFAMPDTWTGGFYELSMEFSSPADMNAALQAIWARPELEGCYLSRTLEPCEQSRITPTVEALEAHGHLLGTATLPTGRKAACGVCQVKEDNGKTWLDFYLPLGSLAAVLNAGGFPFELHASSRSWREPLENWLANIGRDVFRKAPFLLGLVGFEVSGLTNVQEVQKAGIPGKRAAGYLYPLEGELRWHSTNAWEPKPLFAS